MRSWLQLTTPQQTFACANHMVTHPSLRLTPIFLPGKMRTEVRDQPRLPRAGLRYTFKGTFGIHTLRFVAHRRRTLYPLSYGRVPQMMCKPKSFPIIPILLALRQVALLRI
jgi:hypothetical protein